MDYEDELKELEGNLTEELVAAIGDLSEKKLSFVKEVQPPESVIELAAKAAVSVLMAFERGYRMDAG